MNMLQAISPIDGRYRNKVEPLAAYFSEFALIKYRVFVEIQYFIALVKLPLIHLKNIDEKILNELKSDESSLLFTKSKGR